MVRNQPTPVAVQTAATASHGGHAIAGLARRAKQQQQQPHRKLINLIIMRDSL